MKKPRTAGAPTPAVFSSPPLFTLLGLAVGAVLGCGRPAPEGPATYRFEGSTMGTYYAVQVVAEELDESTRQEIRSAIEAELEGVNARMSTWLADSELSRFNRHASATPFELSAPTLEVLAAAREVSATTGGAFDVTVGPLVEAWGFGPGDREPPAMEPEEVRRLLDRIGWEKLEVDPEAGTATKARPNLAVDLSAIAKGYAVDRVSERLAALGHGDHWVEVGGEVRAAGVSARGEPWRLGIERPRLTPGAVQRIVPISELAVATSGDYRNYREVGGTRFSHLIDPRTGWPIRHRLASVSVFHPRCTVADALATAMMVLGEEEGEELARAEGLAVFFLVREGEGFVERGTPEFWRLAGEPAESPVDSPVE